jgi:hypothetical protein
MNCANIKYFFRYPISCRLAQRHGLQKYNFDKYFLKQK